ncbi:D-ala D-ala ligase family protein [Mycobacterium kansasii]|uniref:D-ala D-ala ligase family protein n=1 Tax=Mycobacterium kansasii TaxID=1768 RepID=A0A1V3XTW0_MYCKA|nr:D-ala D-ala ligase family protein [Mycobacterium kansasii]
MFGGRSNEHAISCVSAGSILRNLDPQRFEVIAIGITPQGSWVLTDGNPDALAITNRQLPAVSSESGTLLALPADPQWGGRLVSLPPGAGEVLASVDVVFPVLHGPTGRTAPSRDCSSLPVCPTSVPVCWPVPRAWTRNSPKSC